MTFSNLMAIVCVIANLFLLTKNDIFVHYNTFPNLGVYHATFPNLKGPRAPSPNCKQKSLANMWLTKDPGVKSLIPARSHTFVEIDHEIISMAVLLKKSCCQLQAKVCA